MKKPLSVKSIKAVHGHLADLISCQWKGEKKSRWLVCCMYLSVQEAKETRRVLGPALVNLYALPLPSRWYHVISLYAWHNEDFSFSDLRTIFGISLEGWALRFNSFKMLNYWSNFCKFWTHHSPLKSSLKLQEFDCSVISSLWKSGLFVYLLRVVLFKVLCDGWS